jgi:hypothetical protein
MLNRGVAFHHKTNTTSKTSNAKESGKDGCEIPLSNKGGDVTMISEEDQILTQQSGTGGVENVQDAKLQHKGVVVLTSQDGTPVAQDQVQGQGELTFGDKVMCHDERSLTKEEEQLVRSEEPEEELVDYDEDYEPIEQEKAKMELYEELEAQEAQQQREKMELLEEFAVRMEKLEAVMNFIEGVTSNMQIDDENAKSEEEINNPLEQNQAAADGKRRKKRSWFIERSRYS